MSVFLKYAVNSLQIVGFWPLKTNHKILLFLYNCYFWLAMSISTILVVTMFMEIPNALQHGLKMLGNIIAIGCQFAFSLLQVWFCALPKMKYLLHQVQVTEKNIFKSGTADIKSLFMKSVEVNHIINKVTWFCVLTCLSFYIIIPIIIESQGLTDPDDPPLLPFDLWLPFDKSEYYKTAFVWCVIQGLPISFILIGTSCVYFSMMIFVTSQLRILKYEITQGIDTKKFDDHEIYHNLRKAFIYHNKILKFTGDFNDILKYPMLLAFLIFGVNTALTSFQIATESFSFPLVKNVCYLICATTELWIYYWFANEIYLENEKLVCAIWESDWYNCNIKIRKSLIMIIMRMQRPLRLSVGGLYYMSMETMIMLLKSGVSYAVTLTQFHAFKN